MGLIQAQKYINNNLCLFTLATSKIKRREHVRALC